MTDLCHPVFMSFLLISIIGFFITLFLRQSPVSHPGRGRSQEIKNKLTKHIVYPCDIPGTPHPEIVSSVGPQGCLLERLSAGNMPVYHGSLVTGTSHPPPPPCLSGMTCHDVISPFSRLDDTSWRQWVILMTSSVLATCSLIKQHIIELHDSYFCL